MSVPAARLGRVGSGLAWNLASLVLMGVAGIAANLVAAWYYDASAIGSLNQVMAAFVLAGQAAALGVHLSAQKHLAEYLHDRAQRAAILGGALLLMAAIAAAVTAAYGASAGWIGRALDSEAVARGIVLSTAGLFFFAMNKLVLGALNGLDRLHAYAGYQALRPVLMIAAMVAIAES